MTIAHPKTNIRRTFLEKLCFDFMTDNVVIEHYFCQQVAAEALKNLPKRAKRVFLGSIVCAHLGRLRTILVGREGCKNRYMKREGIDARKLIRTRTIHLCLDS
jgi:hypothetical protein